MKVLHHPKYTHKITYILGICGYLGWMLFFLALLIGAIIK